MDPIPDIIMLDNFKKTFHATKLTTGKGAKKSAAAFQAEGDNGYVIENAEDGEEQVKTTSLEDVDSGSSSLSDDDYEEQEDESDEGSDVDAEDTFNRSQNTHIDEYFEEEDEEMAESVANLEDTSNLVHHSEVNSLRQRLKKGTSSLVSR